MLTQGLPELELEGDFYYNHCSGATDIPDLGEKFMDALTTSPNIKGVILTPLSGPATQEAWINAAKKRNLKVLIEPFLASRSYLQLNQETINHDAFQQMIDLSEKLDVDGYIMPAEHCVDYFFEKTKKPVHFRYHPYPHRRGQLDADFRELTVYEVLPFGLKKIVDVARQHTDKPLIYDNQKAATDIPEMGEKYARICKQAGIDAVILFPQPGTETADKWIDAAIDQNLGVIVGGLMTHPNYAVSDGGYIQDDSIPFIYETAAKKGVGNLVVPGNKPDKIAEIRENIEKQNIIPVFYAPGFIAQGGTITAGGKAAGKYFHSIVGRAINNSENPRQAAIDLTKQF